MADHLTWIDAGHHEDPWAYAESVLSKGRVLEYECFDWNGAYEDWKVMAWSIWRLEMRIDDWGDVAEDTLLEITWVLWAVWHEVPEWWQRLISPLQGRSEEVQGQVTSRRSKGTGPHKSYWWCQRWTIARRWRWRPFRSSFDSWSVRVPEPAAPPKKPDGKEPGADPTGLDKKKMRRSQKGKRGRSRRPRSYEVLLVRFLKHSRKLLRSGMKELSRYLASRAEGSTEEESWSSCKMMTLCESGGGGLEKPQRTHHFGDRNWYADSGGFPQLGDLLIYNLKALEISL